MPAAVRAIPSPEAPVTAVLPMGTMVEVEARTRDGAFLRVTTKGAAVRAGWIWAPLARHASTSPPPVISQAAMQGPKPDPGETARQLKRYRERLHKALARRGVDPLGNDTAAAIGLFRDVIVRVRDNYVGPVEVSPLVDDAIAGLSTAEAAQPSSTTPQELVLASLRATLARLDARSTILTRAQLSAVEAPIQDMTKASGPAEPEADAADTIMDRRARAIGLQLGNFSPGAAAVTRHFVERELATPLGQAPPVGAIVLDLRGNGGGRLDEALAVADMFLPEVEIARTVGRTRSATGRHMSDPAEIAPGMPMLVLVDEVTAAGAEIVAGALQLSGRALLAGRRTAGAASVQTIMPLRDDMGALMLTTGELTLAGGRRFACRGLAPDIRLNDPNRLLGDIADGRRPDCHDAQPPAIDLTRPGACPIPGAEAARDDLGCVMLALRTYVLASPARTRSP
jgi:hypothetical protein